MGDAEQSVSVHEENGVQKHTIVDQLDRKKSMFFLPLVLDGNSLSF